MLVNSLVLSALAGLAAAQFPPKPEGVKIVKSKLHEDVSISYKEPGLCETTPGVKSYAGHVHLPPGLVDGQDYPINTFFWFFEARNDPENAPLAIWHNGGPGSSSMIGLLQEHGPCFIAEDSKTTIHNPWSWNNHVNMLYIDQPNQVGFSYDIPTNVTVTKEGWKPADFSDGVPATNATFHVGTSSTGKRSNAVTRTEEAAHVAWHFAQTFFSEFPHYKPHDDRISIWAESYGGHYGPGFTRFFQKQNEKIAKGELDDKTARPLHLDTLGIVNGCVDTVSRQESAIKMPYKNTYDLQIYNQSYYEDLMHEYHKEGGCRDQLIQCQKELKKAKKLAKGDMFVATAEDKVEYCSLSKRCSEIGEDAYEASDNGRFDIAHPKKDPFPPPHMYGWLTQESVLAALGSPVNFTQHSEAVSTNFDHSGDQIIGFVDAIGYVLDHGIKVAMVYGDRDWACNWIGGETVSLEVPYSRADDFSKAGYEDVHTVDGFSGLTRQFGNFSFTRVFQAGHEVPMYVPGAAYDIFMRAMFNKDIATGKKDVHDDYASKGPADTWHVKQAPPERPETKCYVLAPEGCTEEEWAKVEAGKAIIKDFFVVGFTDDEDVPGDDEL